MGLCRSKEYLRQYRILSEYLRQLEEDIRELEEQCDSVTLQITGMPHASDLKDRTAELAVKLTELHEQALMQREQAWQKRTEIRERINSLGNWRQSRVLYLRYIAGMTWPQIAVEMDYTNMRGLFRMHGRALMSFEKNFFEN